MTAWTEPLILNHSTTEDFAFGHQDTLIGLRQQLDEVKAINVEMYQKMQVQVHTLTTLHVLIYKIKESSRNTAVISTTYDSVSHFAVVR